MFSHWYSSFPNLQKSSPRLLAVAQMKKVRNMSVSQVARFFDIQRKHFALTSAVKQNFARLWLSTQTPALLTVVVLCITP